MWVEIAQRYIEALALKYILDGLRGGSLLSEQLLSREHKVRIEFWKADGLQEKLMIIK